MRFWTFCFVKLPNASSSQTSAKKRAHPQRVNNIMNELTTKYFTDRIEWRKWLETNFEIEDDIWLEYPMKKTGNKRILYNDAVEEALCFGWIDSIVKSLNEHITIQRFCKRRKNSTFSQPNIERLKSSSKCALWLWLTYLFSI